MRRDAILGGLVLALLLGGCNIQWDLDRREIVNFLKPIEGGEPFLLTGRFGALQAEEGHYYLAGATLDSQVLVRRISEAGLWEADFRDFGAGVAYDMAASVRVAASYAVVGERGENAFVIVIGANGELLASEFDLKAYYDAYLGAVRDIKAFAVCAAPGGGFYITGYLRQTFNEDRKVFLMKINQNAVIEWGSHFGNFGESLTGRDLVVLRNGDVVIAGFRGNRLSLMGYSVAGASWAWVRHFGNTRGDLSAALAPSADSTGVVAASINLSVLSRDAVLKAVDNAGNDAGWVERILSGPSNSADESAQALALTREGGFLLAINSAENNSQVAYLVKFDEGGNEEYRREFGRNVRVFPAGVFQTNDFGYACVVMESFDAQTAQPLMLKTDEAGLIR